MGVVATLEREKNEGSTEEGRGDAQPGTLLACLLIDLFEWSYLAWS